MKLIVAVLCFAVLAEVNSRESAPVVQIYAKNPGEYGKENLLICSVMRFHPPDVTITLLKDGIEIPGSEQTELAFEKSWDYQLIKKVAFTPKEGEEYTCRVRHQSKVKNYVWVTDM